MTSFSRTYVVRELFTIDSSRHQGRGSVCLFDYLGEETEGEAEGEAETETDRQRQTKRLREGLAETFRPVPHKTLTSGPRKGEDTGSGMGHGSLYWFALHGPKR